MMKNSKDMLTPSLHGGGVTNTSVCFYCKHKEGV